MIFVALLVVSPNTVFRGAFDFGPLDETEFDEEVRMPWQIMATCRKYHNEAAPIMYGLNRLVFCTGIGGSPGMFWRFPISTRYMPYLTDLGVYMRADDPTKETARRVAHFLRSVCRYAFKLERLTVLISSDARYERACPWDIIFHDHPIAKALAIAVTVKTPTHIKIRLHDGACLYPTLAHFLDQEFYNGTEGNGTLEFSQSCTCARYLGVYPVLHCIYCRWPLYSPHEKPIERLVPPGFVEADMQRMMEMQHELFELGVLPVRDEEDHKEEEVGPYGGGPPVEDTYEKDRLAFTAGMLLPGESRRYKSEIVAPRVWAYEQTLMTRFFNYA